ncbi:hypothetical protein [Nonomuraea sp. NPDC049480]|uniref:hypothetical protein n=1 Tax=Nonomuraea sp. NPDC049480 TaxID=3364353 RepID=UPI003793F54C
MSSEIQRNLDPTVALVMSAIQTLGVAFEKHFHAVASTVSHLGGVYSGIEPRGQGGVAQVVRLSGKG